MGTRRERTWFKCLIEWQSQAVIWSELNLAKPSVLTISFFFSLFLLFQLLSCFFVVSFSSVFSFMISYVRISPVKFSCRSVCFMRGSKRYTHYHSTPSHLVSSRPVSSHLISSHLVSSHLISSHLISSHLISLITFIGLILEAIHRCAANQFSKYH